ncbi:MAG: hypothetical protein WCI61_11980 [Chloroflexota bacterium]
MHDLTDRNQYLEKFTNDVPNGSPPGAESIRQRALQTALDIRKFEIDLYWKRATYFWTLAAATLAGFFILHSRPESVEKFPVHVYLVAWIGFLISLAWFQANRGSKFWQENWELHVDRLETDVNGPLQETVLWSGEPSRFGLGSYPYSVSKIGQSIALFITLTWLGLIVSSVPWTRLQCWWADCDWHLVGLAAVTLPGVFFTMHLIWRVDRTKAFSTLHSETRKPI